LVDVAGSEWVGNVVPGSWADASITLTGVSTGAASVAFADHGLVLAAATVDGLRLRLLATPATDPFSVDIPQLFGSGWVGWRVVPRLVVEGSLELGGQHLASPRLMGYHDHNWGRWHWGDDIGWEWASLLARTGTSIVVARTTDRTHQVCGPFTVLLDHDGHRRSFTAGRVRASWSGTSDPPRRRLPGALAALHDDRRQPRLPSRLHLTARSGRDELELEFTGRSVAQLILADPAVAGTSFLHEMSGRFRAGGHLRGRPFDVEGLGMVERLE
jgi:hypothetical protein